MGIIIFTRNVFLVLLSMSMLLGNCSPISTSSSSVQAAAVKLKGCNLYKGKWIYDPSYPLLEYSSKCQPSIRREYDCIKYGRPDRHYLKYTWRPHGCNLPRFNGRDFLMRLKGKKVMFVGDSVSSNHWQSLVCMLQSAAWGRSNITTFTTNSVPTVTFQGYGVSISMFLSHYLVDIQNREIGRVLNLDSIKDGDIWKQFDILIFNTWLWWYRRGPKQPWDYIENDGKITKDMDRMDAFQKGLTTWAEWVQTNVDPSKTKVFFQGISPSHYDGREWNKPGTRDCSSETTPFNRTIYPGGKPLALRVVRKVVTARKLGVRLLDITKLSQLRKDGHPSRFNGFGGMDCTHWCLAGVPDTWNQLLYAELLRSG